MYVRVAFAAEDFAGRSRAQQVLRRGRREQVPARRQPGGRSCTTRSRSVTSDIVVRKTRFGAFSTTDLYRDLHAKGVDTLVVAGISTSGVVLSTLRDAADQDYRLFVLADATADPDPEVHRVLIEKVFPHQADILDTDDLWTLSGSAAAR